MVPSCAFLYISTLSVKIILLFRASLAAFAVGVDAPDKIEE
jgi:ABC-type uncharacterized transport system YnjBCD permease subunit